MLRVGLSSSQMPIWAVFTLASLVSSYNIDVLVPVIKRGESETAFSISLAPFRDEKGRAFILSGAPLGESSSIMNSTQTGALLACPLIGDDDNCFEIGNKFMTDSDSIQLDRQLFGQSLSVYQSQALPSQSRIFSCAPLHRSLLKKRTGEGLPSSYYPIGMCIELNASMHFTNKEDMCGTAGLSDLSANFLCMGGMSSVAKSKYFVVGAPGAYYQRGSGIASSKLSDEAGISDYQPQTRIDPFTSTGVSYRLPDLSYYLGYSIAMDLNSDDDNKLIMGSPRWSDHSAGDKPIMPGGANLFRMAGSNDKNPRLRPQREFSGVQMGEAFGYSVALINIDNDGGNPDSFIGAPFHANPSHFNEGKVYVFIESQASQMVSMVSDVPTDNALFGAAIASPGDINKDGFNDIVVGAPGEGDDGTSSGTVYIYFGRKQEDGYFELSQKIRARDHSTLRGIRYFGFTVVRGDDLDDNNYPDVLIGSFQSDRAILLRTRSIVIVEASVRFSKDHISLDERTCIDQTEQRNYTCFVVYASLTYSFKDSKDATSNTLPLSYSLTLDVDNPEERLFFAKNRNREESNDITLTRNETATIEEVVYVKRVITDRQTPFQIRLKYGESDDFKITPTRRDAQSLPPLHPTIERRSETVELAVQNNVSVALDCDGLDGYSGCNPDLVPTYKLSFVNNIPSLGPDVSYLVAGEGPILVLNVSIFNRAEEAHLTKTHFVLPPRVTFKNASTVYKEDEDDVTCEISHDYAILYVGYTEVECLVANPLKKNQTKIFLLRLQNSLVGDEGNATIFINTTSDGIELGQTGTNNFGYANFDVSAVSNLRLAGTFFHDNKKARVNYKILGSSVPAYPRSFETLGHNITHRYTVRNFGPTTVTGLNLTIWWPVQTKDKRDFLYLRGFAIPGDVDYECDHEKYVDKSGYAEGLMVEEGGTKASFDEPITDTPPPECKNFFCIPIHCQVNQTLVRRAGFSIIINATAVARTLQQNYSVKAPESSSVLQVHLYKDYYKGKTEYIASIESQLRPLPEEEAVPCVPFWIIMASVLGGLLILAIIVLILYLCGFFRNKSKGQYRVRRRTYVQSPGPGTIAKETSSNPKSTNGGGDFEMDSVEKSRSPALSTSDSESNKAPIKGEPI